MSSNKSILSCLGNFCLPIILVRDRYQDLINVKYRTFSAVVGPLVIVERVKVFEKIGTVQSTGECRFVDTAGIVPRSVYISRKSSSAAALTATVAKEPETGEFCIVISELFLTMKFTSNLDFVAGALMLDNRLGCVHEFDNLNIKNQAAIREAMEQPQ
ncbi:hypothetical protein IGI04_003434 [Brassica rapa subsp. trilocularis]|uniref:MCM C-terminal AAA(+) ATPase domain-containing protein n=1 Tax=Brassica rapa subsp. trilocularis TaxID=1813537 RepID=A0ABQ7NYD6_BRACM|nr:hypothetical protein IGI04_003434 [Brassica rapa subsp. trilocularis]